MKARFAFVTGLGLGLLVGTQAGREQIDRVKTWLTDAWNDPRVQDYVVQAQDQAAQFVKDQSGALKAQAESFVARD
jgi:hypothetical protein